MEVKPAEFARIAGVSRPSVSGKIKNKTLILNAAGMLDTDNPLNAAYIARHKEKRESAAAAEYVNHGGGPAPPPEVSPGKLFSTSPPNDFALAQLAQVPARELLDLTLRDIVIKYPGIDKIERYAKILKDVTMAAEKESRLKERELTLIPKDFVISRIFEFLNTLAKQALEYPEAAADRIISLVQANEGNVKIMVIDTMKEGIGKILTGAKDHVMDELKGLKSKYQNDNHNKQIEDLKEAIETIQEARNE